MTQVGDNLKPSAVAPSGAQNRAPDGQDASAGNFAELFAAMSAPVVVTPGLPGAAKPSLVLAHPSGLGKSETVANQVVPGRLAVDGSDVSAAQPRMVFKLDLLQTAALPADVVAQPFDGAATDAIMAEPTPFGAGVSDESPENAAVDPELLVPDLGDASVEAVVPSELGMPADLASGQSLGADVPTSDEGATQGAGVPGASPLGADQPIVALAVTDGAPVQAVVADGVLPEQEPSVRMGAVTTRAAEPDVAQPVVAQLTDGGGGDDAGNPAAIVAAPTSAVSAVPIVTDGENLGTSAVASAIVPAAVNAHMPKTDGVVPQASLPKVAHAVAAAPEQSQTPLAPQTLAQSPAPTAAPTLAQTAPQIVAKAGAGVVAQTMGRQQTGEPKPNLMPAGLDQDAEAPQADLSDISGPAKAAARFDAELAKQTAAGLQGPSGKPADVTTAATAPAGSADAATGPLPGPAGELAAASGPAAGLNTAAMGPEAAAHPVVLATQAPSAPPVPNAVIPPSVAPLAAWANAILDTQNPGWRASLISRVDSLLRSGDAGLTLSLRPERLGQLQVRVSMVGDRPQVHIQAETQAAARMLAEAEPRLNQLVEQSGQRLGSFTTGFGGADSQGAGQGMGQNAGQNSGQQRQAARLGGKVGASDSITTPENTQQKPQRGNIDLTA